MECMPLRSPPGPYHYLVNDQTKSLQELQNEVGALLEFRDLVIETFPDLKHKMASISASNTITGIPSSSSLASRRDWEPGIRVRRKLPQKETHHPADISASSLIRSRSNSHSGKKEPKSGEGNGSVVQDSGFSTETSSSKETHSESSTNGGGGAAVAAAMATNAAHRLPINAEDELWNLLDVIHRKSTRLREEVEHLQLIERDNNSKLLRPTAMFKNHLNRISKEDVQILRKERDRLLDKLSEMEAETISGRIKANKMQEEVEALNLVKRDLEEQLKAALSQKIELNSRIHDMHQQFVNKSVPSSPESTKNRLHTPTTTAAAVARRLSTDSTTTNGTQGFTNQLQPPNRLSFMPVVLKSSSNELTDDSSTSINKLFVDTKHLKNEFNLGRLDGLVSTPNRLSRVRVTDSKKIAAILLETNIVELQRHLLTLTVQNQVLTQRLEQATKSKSYLIRKLDKAKEDIDDLRFQLEEKNIELEGTKAQLRVIETKSTNKSDISSEHYCSPSRDSTLIPSQVSTPSMKAMVPLAMDEIHHHLHHQHNHHNSSSTESAQDHAECDGHRIETPTKKRPSKIPLPGTKGYLAPKPPTGRTTTTTTTSTATSNITTAIAHSSSGIISQRSPSGPPSNRSLSKSTGSLIGRSGPSSVKKDNNLTSFNRPESAQSIRKDSSLLGQCGRSSSIPISAKISPPRINNSPVPKPKRESLTSKVRNMDSLSRIQSSAPTTTPTGSTTSLYKANSKKDLSSSSSSSYSTTTTVGANRDRSKSATTAPPPVRRVSSASVNRVLDLSAPDSDNGKINITNQSTNNSLINRDLIKEYMARTRAPPPIFKPSFIAISPPPSQYDTIAYTHPALLLASTNGKPIHQEQLKLFENNHEIDIQYIDDNSIELLDTSTSNKSSITKLIESDSYSSKYKFQTRSQNDGETRSSIKSSCKLIGKVNPTLVKTWEQLNRKITPPTSILRKRSASNSSDDRILYPDDVIKNEIPANNKDDSKNYHVNVVTHSESSEDFYDSIDGDDDEQHFFCDTNDDVPSICDVVDNDYLGLPAAGEVMADDLLLNRRSKVCWSIDSEQRVVYKKDVT